MNTALDPDPLAVEDGYPRSEWEVGFEAGYAAGRGDQSVGWLPLAVSLLGIAVILLWALQP